MTIWAPDLSRRTGPKYLAIADAMAADIASGVLGDGEKLPPHRDLAYRLGLTVGTVTRAYRVAEERGLIAGEVGRGTFVRQRADDRDAMTPLLAPVENRPGTVDLARNVTPDTEAERFLAETLGALSREPDLTPLLSYQPAAGAWRHREAGARWMGATGLDAHPDQVVVTNGAQHAITTILMTLGRRGDVVLTEELTYPGLKSLAAHLGIKLKGLAIDHEGLRPDALEEACRHGAGRILHFTPTIQNPTSARMSEERCREIADILKRHDMIAIEDDVFGFQLADRPPPVAAFAPQNVFYLPSAKRVAPGLRVGFAHAPKGMLANLESAVMSTTWMATPLTAEIVSRWISDGTMEHLDAWHQAESAARQTLFRRHLRGADFQMEEGSYHAWLRLPEPWRADAFAAEAEREGVLVLPTSAFAIGRDEPQHGVRICLGCPKAQADLEQGLAVLARLVNAPPRQVAPVV